MTRFFCPSVLAPSVTHVFPAWVVVFLGLGLGACGAKSEVDAQSAADSQPAPVAGVEIQTAPAKLASTSVPKAALLISFDQKGQLRARNGVGSSFLLRAKGVASLEWVLNGEDVAAMTGGKPLFRAGPDEAWRFDTNTVTTYFRVPATATAPQAWRAFATPVIAAWRPLAVEDSGVIAHSADGKVHVASLSRGKLLAKELEWPANVEPPRSAGFLVGGHILWIYGGGAFYLVNVETGLWKVAPFSGRDVAWGEVKSLAFRANPKNPLTLSRPERFAVLTDKGLYALPFVDAASAAK